MTCKFSEKDRKVFIRVSAPNVVTAEMVPTMTEGAIAFAGLPPSVGFAPFCERKPFSLLSKDCESSEYLVSSKTPEFVVSLLCILCGAKAPGLSTRSKKEKEP